MFNTYLALRDTNQIRACLIGEMNRNLFYSRQALPTILNQTTTVEAVLNRMEAICKYQKHEFTYKGLSDLASLIFCFTNDSHDKANVIINEIPLEELKNQILKEQMLGIDRNVYITTERNLIRYTDETPKADSTMKIIREKELNITINTSSLNIFHLYDNEEDGAYVGSTSAEYIYVNEINLKSGKQYKFSNQYDFDIFLTDKVNYYEHLKEINEEKIKAVYNEYWFKDLYSFLMLRKQGKLKSGTGSRLQDRRKLDIKQIIEYSDTLELSKDTLELEANKLVDELFIC